MDQPEDSDAVDVEKLRKDNPNVTWNDLVGLKLARDIRGPQNNV